MPRQEQGIEYYRIQNGEKRYRVRWRENGQMRSRSFLRVSGEDGARAFYARVREAQEASGRLARVRVINLTLAQFVAEVWGPKTKRRLSGKTWRRDAHVYNSTSSNSSGNSRSPRSTPKPWWSGRRSWNGAGLDPTRSSRR